MFSDNQQVSNLASIGEFILLFAGIWIGVSVLISKTRGWSTLSKTYRLLKPFNGRRWSYQNAQLRSGGLYGKCLTIGVNSEGLYLSVLFLFRIGHPPLFIPWTDISIVEKEGMLLTIEFNFQRAPSVPLRISKRLALRMAEAAGTSWPRYKQ